MATAANRDRLSPLFAAAVFVGAWLLFQVQPLVSKAILPWFGGTPGVWTTCMLFFQVALFGGYACAHLLSARVPLRAQGLVYLLLIGIALALLNVLPGADWKPSGREPPIGRILELLLATVGLPYFLLSMTGPLLQRWYSLAHPGRSPYRLYALSNAGSLLALLSYPFLIEPTLAMSAQGRLWSVGFWIYAALCAGCVVALFLSGRIEDSLWVAGAGPKGSPAGQGPGLREDAPAPATQPRTGQYVLWFVLAMTASSMLLAITNQVCQDVAVVPFLWIVPLSLYLLSFILCFDSDRWYRRRWFALTTAALIVAVCWIMLYGLRVFLPLQAAIYLLTLFGVCMLCHGELARMRPDPRHLTAFYLTLSAGGAGGGLFVGLIAPLVFPDFWELHLGLLAGSMIAILVYFLDRGWLEYGTRPPLYGVAAAIVLFVLVGTVFAGELAEYARTIAIQRNFYGVLKVEEELQINDRAAEEATVLRHGHIVHGIQYQNPDLRNVPTAYYATTSGVGRALYALRERGSLKVGVVGLGTGTLAAYGRPGDTITFYEINDAVIRLSREWFTFLSDTPAQVELVPGDARLSLEAEPPRHYDLLALDAFSADAIPTHLLTREAMEVYLKHLDADGVIAIHVSNLHFDLRPVTDALADTFHLATVALDDPGTTLPGDRSSRWVLLTRNASLLYAKPLHANRVPPQRRRVLWTDDFSSLLELLQ